MVELKQGYQGGPHPVRLVSFQEVAVRMQTASCLVPGTSLLERRTPACWLPTWTSAPEL